MLYTLTKCEKKNRRRHKVRRWFKMLKITNLPFEILLRICTFLDFKELESFLRTCRYIREFKKQFKPHEITCLYDKHTFTHVGQIYWYTCKFKILPNGLKHGKIEEYDLCPICLDENIALRGNYIYGLRHVSYSTESDSSESFHRCESIRVSTSVYEMGVLIKTVYET